jgi:hypothetical protein
MLNIGNSVIRKGGSIGDPDYLYYNASIINNSTATTQTADDPAIEYNDTRASTLMTDASEYVVSVENFKIDGAGKNLPIFIPEIQTPVLNVNNTIYSFTFTIKITDSLAVDHYYQSTRFLQWSPENNEPWVPIPTTSSASQPSTYYYCYNIDWFLQMLNNAVGMAWLDCKYAALKDNLLMGTKPPLFMYLGEEKRFQFFADTLSLWGSMNTSVGADLSSLNTIGQVVPTINGSMSAYSPYGDPKTVAGPEYNADEYAIYGMNTNLAQLIANLPCKYFGSNTTQFASGGKRFLSPLGTESVNTTYVAGSLTTTTLYYPELQIIPVAEPNDSGYPDLTQPFNILPLWNGATYDFPELDTAGTLTFTQGVPQYFKIKETSSSIGTMWSPISSIVITTTHIPVRNEYNVSTIPYGSGNIGTTSSTSEAFQKVLIETSADEIDADSFRGLIRYIPNTPTFTALSHDRDGISNVDLRVYWRHRLTNQLVPMTLPNQGSVSVRLLFKRRDVE